MDEQKTNGGGPAGTAGLSAEEELVAALIANPKLDLGRRGRFAGDQPTITG
jgi:hypothetical protein